MTTALAPFLSATEFCDCDHPRLRALAERLTQGHEGPREKARVLFSWVQQALHYRVGHWGRRASDAMLDEEGTCTVKANLLVALLRAVGVPAGYGVMVVDGPRYFGPVAPRFLTSKISRRSPHIYTTVWLDGEWLKVDPADDHALANNTHTINPPSKPVHWSGHGDACLNLDPEHIFEDTVGLPSIDHLMRKSLRGRNWLERRVRGLYLDLGNRFIRFVRTTPLAGLTRDELERRFIASLRSEHRLGWLVCSIERLLMTWPPEPTKQLNESRAEAL